MEMGGMYGSGGMYGGGGMYGRGWGNVWKWGYLWKGGGGMYGSGGGGNVWKWGYVGGCMEGGGGGLGVCMSKSKIVGFVLQGITVLKIKVINELWKIVLARSCGIN